MRLVAKLSVILVAALAVILAARVGRRIWSSSRAGQEHGSGHGQTNSIPDQAKADAPAGTNAPEGFYLGQGDRRTYVNYATSDPLLRSFMQSVMEGNADPLTKGREIFLRICAACHQRDGQGKDGLAPPLAGSEWVLTPEGHRITHIVLNGLSGPVRVREKEWNLTMPPLRENLNDDQIAVVLTFVRSQLTNNHAGRISPDLVAAARKEKPVMPETAKALLRISDD